ncbi:MMPL family transporter [Arcanobacterium canis]
MFTGIARIVDRFPRSMVAAWVAFVALALLAAVWGFGAGGLFTRMATTTSLVPGSQSDIVAQATNEESGHRVLISVTGTSAQESREALAQLRHKVEPHGQVTDPLIVAEKFAHAKIDQRNRATTEEKTAQLRDPSADLMSADGYAVVITYDHPDDEPRVLDAVNTFARTIAPAHARAVSPHLFEHAVLGQVTQDLVTGEAIGLPTALVLLIVIFGGLLAAGLPLVTAIVSIVIGMGEVWGLTFATTVDSYILNVLSIIGLALSIDYGLLMVSRFREEVGQELVRHGYSLTTGDLPDDVHHLVHTAVTAMITTSGRTIAYSALTIIVSISGLLTMAPPMIKMIGAGAMLVTFIAVASALTLLPALIVLLGQRLVRPSILTRIPHLGKFVKGTGDRTSDDGVFSRIAAKVHAHPWPVLLSTVTLLIIAALPIASLQMRSSFIENVPQNSSVLVGYQEIQDRYPLLRTPEATILFPRGEEAPIQQLAAIDGVTQIGAPRQLDHRQAVDVYVNALDPVGAKVADVVTALRSTFPRADVGGAAAMQADFNTAVLSAAPGAIAMMTVSVLILLFFMTGSFIAPLKALIINSFSLIAGMGITVSLFEYGLFGLPTVGGLQTFVVTLSFAFGFGLAMDYEVFLLARVKEMWDKGNSNDRAVELGLQHSGRIITSAAAIIIAVFVGFIFADMLAIKQIGVALAIIVFLDASIVRLLLVPALMTLMGNWNWWAPRWAKKFYEKFRLASSMPRETE